VGTKRNGSKDGDSGDSQRVRRQLHYLADEAWGELTGASEDDVPPGVADGAAREAAAGRPEPPVARPAAKTAFRTRCLGLLRRLRRPRHRGQL
jgi:hypothetical protein